jgi:ATP-dependent Zn protease
MNQRRRQNMKKQTAPYGKQQPLGGKKMPFRWLLMVLVFLSLMMMFQMYQGRDEITNDEFNRYIAEGKIESVEIAEREITGKFNTAGIQSRPPKAPKTFSIGYHPEMLPDITAKLQAANVKWTVAKPQILMPILSWILPIVLMVAFYFYLSETSETARAVC